MTETEVIVTVAPADDIAAKARTLINRCAWGTAGIGLLPIPLVDLVAIGSIQIWMIRELSKYYQVPFSGSRTKALVSGLVGGGVPTLLSCGVIPFIRQIPVVGPIVSLAVGPGLSAASTLAVGRVFNTHFKSGGTLLDFDVEKMRSFFVSELNKAKSEVPLSGGLDASASAATGI